MKNKTNYDELLKKIPNRYFLAISAGKLYKKYLEDSYKAGNFKNQDVLIRKVFKQIAEDENIKI